MKNLSITSTEEDTITNEQRFVENKTDRIETCLTDSGAQKLQQDRQMTGHMRTLMYVETVMACVPRFDSKSPTEIANVNMQTSKQVAILCLVLQPKMQLACNLTLPHSCSFCFVKRGSVYYIL